MDWKATLFLRAFGAIKIPTLNYVRPSVVCVDDERSEVKIPLSRRTKNHLGSMYFGVLAIGADCAGGLLAMKAIRDSKKKVSLVFKGFKVDFLKRPESDTHFVCSDGALVKKLVKETIRTKKRVNHPITIIATSPKASGDEPVARFELILSLKAQ